MNQTTAKLITHSIAGLDEEIERARMWLARDEEKVAAGHKRLGDLCEQRNELKASLDGDSPATPKPVWLFPNDG
jgi:hypothetical protein